ncbi:ParA family protein [Amycolatopsis sp. NPDC004079]|uniref:ParA family protein n=1 Tax=Amycolatopsis sp. NPDC004079 TaxID=3154549 RepID=UPI0033AA5F8A
MKTIAFMSGAAGAGKSASAVTLGTKLALRGQAVCIVDLDRQRTSTFYLNAVVDPYDDEQHYVGDVLLRRPKVKEKGAESRRPPTFLDAIQGTQVDNLFVIAGHANLKDDALALAQANGGQRLREAIRPLEQFIDIVLIDCPGELNILATSAIAAADDVVMCFAPTLKHADLMDVWDTVDDMRRDGSSTAEVAAVMPCIIPPKRQGGFYGEIMDKMQAVPAYKALMTPQVRQQHFEPSAYSHQQPLPIHAPRSEVNGDYDLVLEDLDKRGVTTPAAA